MDKVIEQLNQYLPEDLHLTKEDMPLTKAKLSKVLSEYAKKYPEKYAKNIHKIGELGEELAFAYGHHIGINDLLPQNEDEIDKFLEKEEKKLKLMSTEKKKEHLIKVFNDLQDIVLKNENNHLVDQGKSRGRGNPATITRIIGAPVYTVDMNSEPFPFMIKNSYSKGLKSHEMFAVGSQARYAAVQTASSTSEPGAMSKILVANTEHLKIGCKDCGTKNGVLYKISDPEIIGRYEAGTNKLITKDYVEQLKKQGKKNIMVRDPITCECKEGVCQMCFGHDARNKLLPIGYEIGIAASQTIGEKTTQLVLSTKHDIKGKVKSDIPSGFEALKIILNTPNTYKGKATLSKVDGVVTDVRTLPTGGWSVKIGNEEHYVAHNLKPLVKPGDKVFKGQPISTGLPSTKEIMENQGVLAARRYVQLQMEKEAGDDIDKRIYGVLAKGYLSLVRHKDDEEHNLHQYDTFIKNLDMPYTQKLHIDNPQIHNKYLAKPVLHYDIGTKINDRVLNMIKKNTNIKELEVTHTAPPVVPVYKTYEQRPLVSSNPIWQKLNYRGIKKGLKEELLYNNKTEYDSLQSNKAKYTLGVL